MRSMAGERTHRIGCTVLADEFQNGCVVNLAFKCLAIDLYEFNLVYKILQKSNHGNKAYVFFLFFFISSDPQNSRRNTTFCKHVYRT